MGIPRVRWWVRKAVPIILLAAPASTSAQTAVSCDLAGYVPESGIAATMQNGVLGLEWAGAADQHVRLEMAVRGRAPLVERLAVRTGGSAWSTVVEGGAFEYRVVEGLRRMSNQQMVPLRELEVELTQEVVDRYKWDAFHDAPLDLRTEGLGGANPPPVEGVPGTDQPPLPRSPAEIRRADVSWDVTGCTVETDGLRVSVTYPGVTLGTFSGELVITVFEGTNLIETKVVASTDLPSVAYKYDAGIAGLRHGPDS